MQFSILHLSDLHRDLSDEVDNSSLLESLVRDVDRYSRQVPAIAPPSVCIVSGDLVYGAKPTADDAANELKRQYEQVESFLGQLTDAFFAGNRERIVLVPGNHDVAYHEVIKSVTRIEIPREKAKKTALVEELFKPRSLLRWSWEEMCFYRITDEDLYRQRFKHFASTYHNFYRGSRAFSVVPEEQYGIFDYPELNFCVLALNSCHRNDPLRRAAAFHPGAVSAARKELRQPERTGRLIASTWHHSLFGGPTQDDYLDVDVLQILMDAGVSLGFHGHQHLAECVDERYRSGVDARKMTIVSAGTLCSGPRHLTPGSPRSFNVVEIDTQNWQGRVHQRRMVNSLYSLPLWGPGHFTESNLSYLDFDIACPLVRRPDHLDDKLALERLDELVGSGQWYDAIEAATKLTSVPLARPLLRRALVELNDCQRTLEVLWPPQTPEEAVLIGGALLQGGNGAKAEEFLKLQLVADSTDASVREVSRRVRERRIR